MSKIYEKVVPVMSEKFIAHSTILRTALLGGSLTLLLSACGGTDEVIEKAVNSIGGEAVLASAIRLSYDATGQRYHAGQSAEANGGSRDVGSYQSSIFADYDENAFRIDMVRDVTYPFNLPYDYSSIIRGSLGVQLGSNNLIGPSEGDMASTRWAAIRKENLLMTPHTIIDFLHNKPDAVTEIRTEKSDDVYYHVLDVDLSSLFAHIDDTSLYFNKKTGQLKKIKTLENDHLQRDVELEISFNEYKTVDGLSVPSSLTMTLDGELIMEENRTAFVFNPVDLDDDLSFPLGSTPIYNAQEAQRAADNHQWHQQFESIGVVLDEESDITANEIMPGIYTLQGGIYNSLVVEQELGIIVVDASLYERRSEQVISWAQEEFPNKQITHLISTHHHIDHTGGLRTFVAEGAIIVASERAEAFYQDAFEGQSTVIPDRLAAASIDHKYVAVPADGSVHLPDARYPINVIHLESSHSDDMVVVSLPGQSLLFSSDLYSKGFPIIDPAIEYRDQILALGLPANILVAGHGQTTSFAELESDIAAEGK